MHNIKWKIGSTLKKIKLFVKFGKHDIGSLCLLNSQDKTKEMAHLHLTKWPNGGSNSKMLLNLA
jgi:hypothetical protein